jgi:hypothetical protein
VDPDVRIRRWCGPGLIGLGAAGLIGGCTSGQPVQPTTVTVTASRPAAGASSSPGPAGASATTSPSAPVTSAPPTVSRLRGTCDTLLPLAAVDNAIGQAAPGSTAFVVGLAEKDIGRLAYLNCRYAIRGVAAGNVAVPGIEIGISLYNSAAQAQRRMADAVADDVDHGAIRTSLTILGHDAALLAGATDPAHEIPLLVVASGQRTVAVSVTSTFAPAAQRGRIMTALATLALTRTGG